jgi:xanthine dehydrogenase accessory factor
MGIRGILRKAESCEQRSVLATVIEVEGHAYRKTGSAMLLMEDGTLLGSISPGCMESDLQARIPHILESGAPEIVDYDFRSEDDILWGEDMGCGGEIRVLLEPLSGTLLVHLQEVNRLLDGGKSVILTRIIRRLPLRVMYRMLSIMPGEKSHQLSIPIAADEQCYVCNLTPEPRLIIFGAGNDTIPVAKMAASSGFETIVADWREGLLAEERFPDAECVLGLPVKLLKEFKLKESDYVVVMSHQLRRDREFLQMIEPYKLQYVGIMGSSARTDLLLEGMSPPAWFHYPVGLNIGADGPEEIAVSIVAELIQIKRSNERRWDKDGGHEEANHRDIFGRWKKQSNAASQAFHRAIKR